MDAGSRSSPLTTAIAQHPRARIVPCIDERSLCFWALGYGRATGRPAVVVTSSGTAVANLLPAAVEASQSNVPLLMLTADRPTELRDTGANQTIDQVKIFGSYVRWECDVGAPSDQVPARVALTTIGAAVRHACATHAGPVHVNCQFRDPLAPAPEPWDRGCLAGLDRWEQGNEPFTSNTSMHVLINAGGSSVSSLSAHIDNSALNGVLSTLKHAKRGLIVVGELTSPEDAVAAVQLGKFLGWPVAADVLSGIRVGSVPSEGASLVLVNHFDHILLAREHWPELQPDVVLQLGGHVTSKRTSQFLEWAAQGAEPGQEATSWIFVDRTPRRHDQGHLVTHRLQSSINGLLGALRLATYDHDVPRPAGVMAEAEQSYCILLTALDAVASSAIDDMLQSFHDLTEPGVARLLSRELPPGEGLFIGNSMPIRDLDMYGLPAQYGATQTLTKLNESLAPQGVVGTGLGAPVGANRGASGIDGVLSTAAGFADGLGRGCTLVVGDISFLHDINGLNLLRSGEMRPPLTVVLVNNGGGGIFSFLPIAEHLPDDVFTPLWATPQHVDLAGERTFAMYLLCFLMLPCPSKFIIPSSVRGICAGMCRAHSIPHLKVGSAAELRKALHSAWGLNRHSVIEVVTSRTSNVDRHREVQAAVQSAVTSILRKRLERNLSKPELQSCLAINSAKWTAFELPLSRPLTTESGAGAAYRRGLLLEVEIGTNNSPVKGVGEVSPLPGLHAESLEDATAQIAAVCEAISGARVPLDCALLHGGMASWMLAAGIDVDQLYPSVRCALEAAVLSCISQHLKQPIASVALSRSTALPAAPAPRVNGLLDPSKYDTIEAATAAAVALVTESGFSALKVKVGRMPPPRGPLYDAATVLAIRAAVGPGVVLRADANQAWCLEDAIAFGSAVAPTGLEYVEEPLADPTFEALAAFHRATGVHTALDESIDAGRYLCESSGGKVPEGVAAVVLKPLVLGGFERTLAIVRRAQRLGVRPVISSAFESPVGLKQLAQLAVLVDPDCSTHHGLATEDWFGEGVPRVTENMAHGQLPRRCIPTGDQPWSGVLNIAAALAPFLSQRPALSADSFTVATAAAQISPDLTVDWQVLEAACAPGQGHATPVVFVHGMFGCAPEWKPYMAALRTVGRPSWAVYLPYHGETSVHASSTENCPSRHPKSLDVAANALAALLDTKGVTRCTIVGYSMGARIALLLAARRPELFERVVSIGGTPGLEGDAACAERAAADGVLAGTLRQQLLPGFLQSHWYTAPIWCSLRKHPFFDTLVGTRSRELGAYYEELAEVLEQASPGRTSPVWSELEQRAQEGTLPPVTMIVGALDTKFTAIAEDLKRRLGGGHVDVVIVPAAGHAAHVERQLYVMRLLMEQLA